MIDQIQYMFIIPTRTNGGAERAVSILASGLAKKGIKTAVLQFERYGDEYELHKNVINILLNEKDYPFFFPFSVKKMLFIRKCVREYRPQFVFPFLGNVLEIAWVATRLSKSKYIGTVRNNPWLSPRTEKERKRRNFIFKYSDGVFLQTEGQKEYFNKDIQHKSFIVSNPVAPEFLRQNVEYRESIVNFIAVGRLVKQKNYSSLIECFSKVIEKNPKLHLSIYGDGPLRIELLGQIAKLGLEKHIEIHNRTNNIIRELLASDAFIMNSNFEGFPNALLEAMALGLPCIATDCKTGPSDLIQSGINGLLVPLESNDILVEKILWMADYVSEAQRLGKEARKTVVNNYTEELVIEKLIFEVDKLNDR